jgi:hypothetical protein
MTRRGPSPREIATLAALTIGAIFVHGYHPGVEDAEIYLPGILKRLHPGLFPRNTVFFESHAHMTLFPRLIAGSIEATRLPVGVAVLAWHAASIFLLLLACWRIGRLCFPSDRSVWAGVALIGSLLTLPIAGTDLYIMDQYLTPRSLSTPLSLLAAGEALAGRPWRAIAWLAVIAPIHPLMSVFAGALVASILLVRRLEAIQRPVVETRAAAVASPLALPAFFPPVTAAYRQVLATRPAFLLTRWAWYEWLGLLGPFVIVAGFARLARRHGLGALQTLCRAVLLFEAGFFALALVVSMPGPFERFAEIQPMRSLQLVYVLMFLVIGGFAGRYLLGNRAWRWAVLFVPLCTGMWYAQRQLFPASRQLELPGLAPRNHWVQTFQWIREHTPVDAYFALDPQYLRLPGEDTHGFRAIAERSRMADAVKDSGVASMFPQVSEVWLAQVAELRGWDHFTGEDFAGLHAREGVDWVVTRHPVAGLTCVYRNDDLSVCRIDGRQGAGAPGGTR